MPKSVQNYLLAALSGMSFLLILWIIFNYIFSKDSNELKLNYSVENDLNNNISLSINDYRFPQFEKICLVGNNGAKFGVYDGETKLDYCESFDEEAIVFINKNRCYKYNKGQITSIILYEYDSECADKGQDFWLRTRTDDWGRKYLILSKK